MSSPVNQTKETSGSNHTPCPPLAQNVAEIQATKTVGVFQQAAEAGFGGYVAGVSIAPLVYAKNTLQKKKDQERRFNEAAKQNLPKPQEKPIKFDKNPRVWVRGANGLGFSLGPISLFQKGLKATCDSALSQNGKKKLSNSQEIMTATAAGMVSGFPMNISTVTMLRQQTTGESFYNAFFGIFKANGCNAFVKTATASVAKEGGSAAAFFGVAPVAKRYFQDRTGNEAASRVFAGVLCGGVVVLFTQPFDNWQTVSLSNPSLKIPMFKSIFQRGAHTGGLPRWGMFTLAGIVIPLVVDKAGNVVAYTKDKFFPRT